MDCTKLHQDIARLTRQKDQLESKLRHANETMQGKSELKSLISASESLETSILEDHLHAFAEKNPWLTQWQFGDLIPGFTDERGRSAHINSIAPLLSGDILTGGEYGALHICTKGEDGTYQLGDLIPGFKDIYGFGALINSIFPLQNGNALIGGNYGALYECIKDENGTYHLSNRITGFKDREGAGVETSIYSIAPLPNGNILIGGRDGALYECNKNEDGVYRLGDPVLGFKNKFQFEVSIYSIAPLPNGNMLIGGSNGALYEYIKDEDDGYHLGDLITGFENERGPIDIRAIAPLSNGNMLICGDYNALYEYIRGEDGTYHLGNRITGFKNKIGEEDEESISLATPLPNGNVLVGEQGDILYEYIRGEDGTYHLGNRIAVTGLKDENPIRSIAALPNGNALIGGYRGVLREAHKPPLTVDTLRQNLDRLED